MVRPATKTLQSFDVTEAVPNEPNVEAMMYDAVVDGCCGAADDCYVDHQHFDAVAAGYAGAWQENATMDSGDI